MKELDTFECMLVNGGSYGSERLERRVNISNYGTIIKGINTIREVVKAHPEVVDVFIPKPHYNHTVCYWKGGF